jgi:hypothetical protein
MKVEMKVGKMLPTKFVLGKVKMMKIEEEESVLKHKKLDESKDDVKLKKNESMFGSKSILDEEKWILPRACATAVSFFVVAHSSAVRTFPETLHFAVFFFFFVCTRFLLDLCGMSGALIRRTHARRAS